MDSIVLDRMPLQIDIDELLRSAGMNKKQEFSEMAKRLTCQAEAIGRPRAMYKVANIEEKGPDFVIVDGRRLNSRVLRVNLDEAHKVFPYVATCGTELDDWSKSFHDVLERYIADTINQMVVTAAGKVIEDHIRKKYNTGKISRMNPGSTEDWPLKEQDSLFAILGNPEVAIGVKLNSSFLMVPIKSVSGIWFPAESSYEDCQLCPRKNCPGRSSPYDKDLYQRRYSINKG